MISMSIWNFVEAFNELANSDLRNFLLK